MILDPLTVLTPGKERMNPEKYDVSIIEP